VATYTQETTAYFTAHFYSSMTTVFYLAANWFGWWGNTMKVGFDYDEMNPGAQEVSIALWPLTTITTTRICKIYSFRIGY
jgi:hypothetical protein